MAFLRGREDKGGIWLTEKAATGEGDPSRVEGLGQWKDSQATRSQCSTSRETEATPRACHSRVTPSGDSLVNYAEGLTQDTFKICKEFLRPFKKCLRQLNLPKDWPKEKRLMCTRKNLVILGDHINMFLQHYCKTWELKRWKKMLWRFVALFSALNEKQLCKLYRYSKTNQVAKFLKAYYRLESPDWVTRSENDHLMTLRNTWALHGDAEMQEKLVRMCSQPPDDDNPAGSIAKKRC